MLSQTLEEISQMSQQIQRSIRKAINQSQNSGQATVSLEANYRTYPQTQNKKRKHKHSRTIDEKPTQLIDPNSSHIRQFMLEQENELLKQQLSEVKQKNKVYRTDIKQFKRYIKFLEDYNDGLKKEVVLWMTRPAKKETIPNQTEMKIKDYRLKLNDIIMNRSAPSKQKNISTNHNSINLNDPQSMQNNNTNSENDNCEESDQITIHDCSYCKHKVCKIMHNAQDVKRETKNYQSLQLNRALNGHQCTSCNYLEYVKAARHIPYSNISNLFENKQNRVPLHIDRTQQKKSKKQNSPKIYRSNESGNKYNQTVDLKTYRTDDLAFQKYNNLCDCHQNFLRNRKF